MTPKTGSRILWAVLTAALLAAIATLMWNKLASPPAQTAPDTATQPSGFVDSAAYVTATLAEDGRGGGVVRLHIDDGWHVNANPASLEGLIPTTVIVEESGTQREIQADYPLGHSIGIFLEDADILVYDDGASITLQEALPESAGQLHVHVQSCSDAGLCLPPATIAVGKGDPA